MSSILVFGGVHDPNVHAVIEAARKRGIEAVPLLIGEARTPSLRWNLASDELWVDGSMLTTTAVFARQDAFHSGGPDANYRAIGWYATLLGWLAACPAVRILNRGYLGRHTNKLDILRLARASGLTVPETLVTNDTGYLTAAHQIDEMIAKPVPGGGFCTLLDDLLAGTESRDGVAATPAIVQRRLDGADVRLYRIGDRTIGFRIDGAAVDYRTSRDCHITRIDRFPGATVQGLECLMKSMSLDWGAADFKGDPEGEQLVFLEINSNPMFSTFDRFAAGTIAESVVGFLMPG